MWNIQRDIKNKQDGWSQKEKCDSENRGFLDVIDECICLYISIYYQRISDHIDSSV